MAQSSCQMFPIRIQESGDFGVLYRYGYQIAYHQLKNLQGNLLGVVEHHFLGYAENRLAKCFRFDLVTRSGLLCQRYSMFRILLNMF